MHELANEHGVVLHRDLDEIWFAHPFSLAPIGIVVRKENQRWWCNCAWCAMGAVELPGGTASITLPLGGEDQQVTMRIENGNLLDDNYAMHFPVPMANAWDNIAYTCAMMLPFENVAAVEDLCKRHRKPRGDVVPVAQFWPFAREWYGQHLSPTWSECTIE